jgi:hypothetical protein
MTKTRTLISIVTENWDNIASNLNLEIENKPKNMLLMLSYLRPLLDSAAAAFPRPSIATSHSVKDEYKEHMHILEKMGLVKCPYTDTYGLTFTGFNLMECYHKSTNPNYLTESEWMDKIIARSDHLYEEDNNTNNNGA